MAGHLFPQTTIAIIWDFDSTLIPGYMQDPLFKRFKVDAGQFWKEVNALPQFYANHGATRVSRDTVYLNHMLSYVRSGRFAGLNNASLRELGKEIKFYPGLPEFFQKVKDRIRTDPTFSKHQINVEHYVVSTGLREMIMGSEIGPHVDGVWACEFAEASAPPDYLQDSKELFDQEGGVIREIAYALDNTSKTRAIFEINKGTNKEPQIDVNATIAQEIRRVPFPNMIYIADGPSDIPSFSLLNQYGGRTYAVYKPKADKEFRKAYELQKQRRVEAFGEADYTDGSQTSMWLVSAVEDIARRIVRDRERILADNVEQPVGHIIEQPKPAVQSAVVLEAITGGAVPIAEPPKKNVSGVKLNNQVAEKK